MNPDSGLSFKGRFVPHSSHWWKLPRTTAVSPERTRNLGLFVGQVVVQVHPGQFFICVPLKFGREGIRVIRRSDMKFDDVQPLISSLPGQRGAAFRAKPALHAGRRPKSTSRSLRESYVFCLEHHEGHHRRASVVSAGLTMAITHADRRAFRFVAHSPTKTAAGHDI